jgi:cell division transport system permease protein
VLAHLIYMLRRALRNMRQSPFLCFAAIGTVAVALCILAFFAIIVQNVQNLTAHWSEEVQVVAYIDTLPEARQLEQWQKELRQLAGVQEVHFVSRQEAFARFKQRMGTNADLLDGLNADFLPASLEIGLKPAARNRAGIDAVLGHLRKNPSFSDLRYGQEWLERFETFLSLLQVAGAILGGFLLFATLFIVSNTIKLTLYARRDELEIMALVGGTSTFIKLPFLIEGALQGVCGGVLALGCSFALFQLFLREGLGRVLLSSGVSQIAFLPLPWQGGLVAAGTALGFFGSLFALRKLVRI